MVRTRLGTRIDSFPVRGRKYSSQYSSELDEDPLMDIASHLPATLVHSKIGESTGRQDDSAFFWAEVSLPEALDR